VARGTDGGWFAYSTVNMQVWVSEMSLHTKPSRRKLNKRRERARKALVADPERFYLRRHKRKHATRKKKVMPLSIDDFAPPTLEEMLWL
jgi:hypothetical protein